MKKIIKILSAIILLLFLHTNVFGSEKIVVSVYSKGKGKPPWDLKNYGIKIKKYETKLLARVINHNFIKDLQKAQMLYFCRSVNNQEIFKEKAYCDAIANFLKQGGLLYFEYNAGPSQHSGTRNFFKENGLGTISELKELNYFKCEIDEANSFPLLNIPNKLSKYNGKISAYGGVLKWSENQQVLAFKKEAPELGALLIHENAQGKGKVIINRIYSLSRPMERHSDFENAFVENLVNYVWGKISKGIIISSKSNYNSRIKSITNIPVSSLNPLYFRNLLKAPWWNKKWNFRIPLIVRESLGADRKMIVTFEHAFPKKTDISSIRVISVGGREIPSQTYHSDPEKNIFRISFSDDFNGQNTNCYFIYFDSDSKPEVKYDTDLTLSEKDGQIILNNNLTKAVLNPDYPIVSLLQANGASTDNHFYRYTPYSKLGAGLLIQGPQNIPKAKAKIVENGALRKVVEYRITVNEKPLTVRFIMNLVSRGLFYEFISFDCKNVQCMVRWLPGNGWDSKADSFYYPGLKAIKKIDFGYEDRAPLCANLIPLLGEGWYAFSDNATGQIVGELFDLSQVRKIHSMIYSCWGYTITNHFKLESGKTTRAVLLPLPDTKNSLKAFRKEYLLFKNPPQIAIAKPQKQTPSLSKNLVPEWGKDFIGGCHLEWHAQRSPEAFAYRGMMFRYFKDFFRRLKDKGYNMIDFWPKSNPNIFLPGTELNKNVLNPMKKEIKKNGFFFFNWTRCNQLGYGLPHWKKAGLNILSWEDMNYKEIQKVLTTLVAKTAQSKSNACFMLDETSYRISPKDKSIFRKIYGMDPVIEIDLNKLSEPQQYNTVLFQMNAYTEILKNMTESAKKVNPKLIVADQVNISSMCSLSFHNKIFGAPHDWERHSDFLDTVSMDLYNAPRDYYKYWNKYQCAMFNNKKAVMLITGCTTAYDKVASAIAFPLMWGVKVVEFFPPRNTDIVKAWQEAGRTFSYFNFTGLGDLLVRSNPQKHVALLRDRAGMINAIKTGQWMRGRGNLYDDKIAQMTYIKNLQTDIIMSKYFNSNNLKDYPLLYIVDNPVISDKFIDTIAEYVKNGGNAIIEGKGIRNKRMQKLAGVSFSGKIYDISNNVNGFCPFKFTGKICQILPLDGNVLCKFADGTPVLTEKKLGKGKILYLAPIISSKISAQDDISYFIRNLFRRLAGKQIITIENDDINEIDSNIMTDGKGNYIFCAWNPDFETKTVKIKWNGSSRPEVIINFANGSVSEFKEIFSFELPQDQIKQFFIGKNGIVNIPEHNVLSPGNIPDYSSEPNKDILNYKLEKKSNCAVKHSPKLDGTSYVAVFKPVIMGKNISTGAKSIYNSLLNLRGINVEYINDLNPETISYYDAVIIPNIGYHSVSKDWECNIREYVLNGGSVFLNHRTVGYAPCKFPPFPEIGKNSISGVVPQRDIKIVMQHPLTNKLAVRKRYPDDYNNPAFQTQIDLNAFKVGDSYQFGFCDYVPLKPGKNGAVIARSCKNNDPVIIAGKTGKGKAVLAGMSIGQDEKGREKINVNDKKILINSIYWLTEKID